MNEINTNNLKSFYVIKFDINGKKFIPYDVMPFFINEYKNETSKKPVSFEECKEFIQNHSLSRFWSRCEYEVVLHDWPIGDIAEKIDIHYQIMMNIDIVTNIFIENLKII